MISPYVMLAGAMLSKANVSVKAGDIALLAKDIRLVATEDLDADDDTNALTISELAQDAASILERRIGGLANLDSYMKCLRGVVWRTHP